MFRLTEQVETSCARWFRDKRFLGFSFGLISRQENEHRPQKFYKFPPVLLRTKKDPGEKGGSIYMKFYKIHSPLLSPISKKTRSLILISFYFSFYPQVRRKCGRYYDISKIDARLTLDTTWFRNFRAKGETGGGLIIFEEYVDTEDR